MKEELPFLSSFYQPSSSSVDDFNIENSIAMKEKEKKEKKELRQVYCNLRLASTLSLPLSLALPFLLDVGQLV